MELKRKLSLHTFMFPYVKCWSVSVWEWGCALCKMTASTSMKHYKWRYWVSLKYLKELVGFGSWFRNLHFRLVFLENGKATSWSMASALVDATFLLYNSPGIKSCTKLYQSLDYPKKAVLFSVFEVFLDRMPLPFRKKKKRYESLRPTPSRNF